MKLSGDQKRVRMLKLDDSDYTSEYFLFIAFSILESQGYQNLIEIMSIIEDPKKIMQILYLLNGMNLKLPTVSELTKALKASSFIYTDTVKSKELTIGEKRNVRPVFLRDALQIDENEEQELLQTYNEWITFMEQNGYPIDQFLPIVNARVKKMLASVRRQKKYISPIGDTKKRKDLY